MRRRRNRKIVVLRGLVEDDRDHTVCLLAELVLRSGVGEAAGALRSDVFGGVIRIASNAVNIRLDLETSS